MIFIFLVFLAALSIESIGTYISVLGLAATFAADPVIITMAVALDFGKIVVVSLLYKKWNKIHATLKILAVPMAIGLMVITSSGTAGYLSAAFQKATLPNSSNTIALKNLTDEQARLQARKKDIDTQISSLPANMVRGRTKLINTFKDETVHINTRLVELDKEIPAVQTVEVTQQAHIGPIAFVSKAFNITMESAVSYIILLIIFVFDPLAILLIIAGNFLIDERTKELQASKEKLRQDELDALEFDFKKEKLKIKKEEYAHEHEIHEAVEPAADLPGPTEYAENSIGPIEALSQEFIPKRDEPIPDFNEIHAQIKPKRRRKVKVALDEPMPEIKTEDDLKSLLINSSITEPEIEQESPEEFADATFDDQPSEERASLLDDPALNSIKSDVDTDGGWVIPESLKHYGTDNVKTKLD